MKAMVLAAGEGTRLRPLTLETPKVLLPVGGRPLILHILEWLKKHGISEVAINLYYLGEKIRDYLGDGSRFGMRLVYSWEERLLGTAGALRRMVSFFDTTFAVVYGDVLTNLDLSKMADFHRERRSFATLAIYEVADTRDKGIVRMDEGGRIWEFVERPPPGSEPGNLANGGIYILERKVLGHIPEEGYCDFAYDLFPRFLKLGLPLYGFPLAPHEYLIDIGTPQGYARAEEIVKAGKVKTGSG